MLILTRRLGESLFIGKTILIPDTNIEVKVLGIKGNQVRIGINAPKDVEVHREEVVEKIRAERQEDLPA